MKRYKLALLAGLLALCALALGGCSQRGGTKGTLRVGVRAEINNFGYLNPETHRYSGLEIDLANAIAEALGYAQAEFLTAQPEMREALLENGKADCVIACFSVTPERRERFDFSTPYYTDSLRVMVERSTLLETPEQLGGCLVGVLRGSNAAQQLLAAFPGLDVRFAELDHYSALSNALESGEIDAVCLDGCIAQAYMNDDRALFDAIIAPQAYAVATPKGSPLSAKIASAVDALLASGELSRIIDKWN